MTADEANNRIQNEAVTKIHMKASRRIRLEAEAITFWEASGRIQRDGQAIIQVVAKERALQ